MHAEVLALSLMPTCSSTATTLSTFTDTKRMSAKFDQNRKRTHNRAIHSTPPEIWSTIFRLAVGEHICEDQFTSSEGLRLAAGLDRKQLKAFRTSLVTRRYIIRVSKAWYEMASPLLYEYVLLGRARSIFPLRDTMVTSRRRLSEANDGERPIGWWTKRLDVQMRDDGTAGNFDPYLVLDAVAEIIACLPNLRILTFLIIGHGYNVKKIPRLPSKVLCSLSCRESLKVVHWYNRLLRPKVDDWTSFLQNHPYLESVRCKNWSDISPDTNVKLPSLKIAYSAYKFTFYDFMQLELPAVRFAVYDESNTGLLSQLGEQLTVLQIEKSETEAYDPQALFAEIREKCVNLLQVNLIGFLLPDMSFPSTVRVLGLDLIHTMSKGGAKYVLLALPNILSQNPNLKVIRLLSGMIAHDLKLHPHALINLVKQMESSGIILLDNEDCPITSGMLSIKQME